jgi:hypothetical protein
MSSTDPRVRAGRVRPNIGEVHVEGEEHAAFRVTSRGDVGIFGANERLFEHSVAIPASSSQNTGGLDRHVLINLPRIDRL